MKVLTPRQWEVLRYASLGATAAETATTMGLATETVKWHRKAALVTLGARNMQQAVAHAIQRGLLP